MIIHGEARAETGAGNPATLKATEESATQ